jgi:hypothetical protein
MLHPLGRELIDLPRRDARPDEGRNLVQHHAGHSARRPHRIQILRRFQYDLQWAPFALSSRAIYAQFARWQSREAEAKSKPPAQLALLQEPIVMTHQKMGFHLAHGIEQNADHD